MQVAKGLKGSLAVAKGKLQNTHKKIKSANAEEGTGLPVPLWLHTQLPANTEFALKTCLNISTVPIVFLHHKEMRFFCFVQSP